VKYKFKVGDLVELSDFGKTLAGDWEIKYGIVVKGPYSMGLPGGGMPEGFYMAYDVMIGDELFKRIPSQFILRMDRDEDGNKQVEKVAVTNAPKDEA
tara:strand:+ start:10429 stop:10719 length:291 start_codon:yes stop_codon:yes gene_type:complete